MAIFKKKKEEVAVKTTAEMIVAEKVVYDDDSYAAELAAKVIEGYPLFLNFEGLNVDNANKMIAFLSGVCFAISGRVQEISETVFLFTNNEAFIDGSLEKWMSNNL